MGTAILVSLVFGLVIAAVILFFMMSAMKTVRPNNTATDYRKKDSLKLTQNRDLFLYKKVEKTERNNN